MRKGTITMSQKEVDRVHVLQQTVAHRGLEDVAGVPRRGRLAGDAPAVTDYRRPKAASSGRTRPCRPAW